jgi:hypothetical protein
MKNIFTRINNILYYRILPKNLRFNYETQKRNKHINSLKQKILDYYNKQNPGEVLIDIKIALDYLQNNPISVFPYAFEKKYIDIVIDIKFDPENMLKYVMVGNKKLFFPKNFNDNEIKFYFKGILTEQDVESPHCYLSDKFRVEPGDIIGDIGVAEGIFALSVIEKVSKVYLFEKDESWTLALRATFSPWIDKVEIINAYVSDIDNHHYITLDNFFMNRKIDFLKIDVDGGEKRLLKGAEKLLTQQDAPKVAICSYHNQQDASEFELYFLQHGFEVSFTEGFMLFIYDFNIAAPFFRKGVLRALKKQSSFVN